MKKTHNDEKISHIHGLEELILLGCPLYPELSRFNTFSIKILVVCFVEPEKNPKIPMKSQKTINSQNNLEKEQRWRHYTS